MHSSLNYWALALCLLLMACGGGGGERGSQPPGTQPPETQPPSTQPPVINAGPGSSGKVETLQFKVANVASDSALGTQQVEAPEGITASYRLTGKVTHVRIDMAGDMFLDGIPRVVFTNGNSGRAKLFIKQGDKLKPVSSQKDLQLPDFKGTFDFAFLFNDIPFTESTPEAFIENAQEADFTVVSRNEKKIKVKRKFKEPSAEKELALTFDEEVGAVTEVEERAESEKGTARAVAKVWYAKVNGVEKGIVPYEVSTELKLSSKEKIPPVKLPTVGKTNHGAQPNGDKLQSTARRTVVREFSAPPGEGLTDFSTKTITSTVRYEDIEVNTLSSENFLLKEDQ